MEKVKPLRVVRDFYKSPYRAKVGCFLFVFSSRFNVERFRAALDGDKQHFKTRCNKLYGLSVCFNSVSPFALYSRIERRGYLVFQMYGESKIPIHNPKSVQIVADVRVQV